MLLILTLLLLCSNRLIQCGVRSSVICSEFFEWLMLSLNAFLIDGCFWANYGGCGFYSLHKVFS